MPYIKPEDKKRLEMGLFELTGEIHTPGDLTYVIFVLARRMAESEGIGYACLSKTRASIQDAADEFYRRLMAPYEDRKMEENGDAT